MAHSADNNFSSRRNSEDLKAYFDKVRGPISAEELTRAHELALTSSSSFDIDELVSEVEADERALARLEGVSSEVQNRADIAKLD